MEPVRVAYYMNQFFAGRGGEEKADAGPAVHGGPVGPAVGLQSVLGGAGEVVVCVSCGDSYLAQEGEPKAVELVEMIKPYRPGILVAGPAFGSGRYGLGCGMVCVAAQEELRIPAVTAMSEGSPGAGAFRGRTTIIPTSETAAGMRAALADLARLALKLGHGEVLGPAAEDGYLPSGRRYNRFVSKQGADRAIDMLVEKVRGREYVTEWPLPVNDAVRPPAPVQQQGGVKVALVSEGGVVPKGNPDRLPSAWSTRWGKYSLQGVLDLGSDAFETVHGGFNAAAGNEDPDRLIPVDVLRQLEGEGRVALHPYLYSTVGNMGLVKEMRRIGSEIAADLTSAGVQAVIVGST